MTVSINAVLGHRQQDALMGSEAADAYFAKRTEADAWTALSSDNKKVALVTATSIFQEEFPVLGQRLFRYLSDPLGTPASLTDTRVWLFEQALQLPKVEYRTGEVHILAIGTADSATTSSVVNAGLSSRWWDDDFNEGSMLITSGDLEGTHVRITDFARATGTFTTESMGATPPAAGDGFYAIGPLPKPIQRAFLETVLNVARGQFDTRANMQAEGVASVSMGGQSESFNTPQGKRAAGIIPFIASEIMARYIASTVSVL